MERSEVKRELNSVTSVVKEEKEKLKELWKEKLKACLKIVEYDVGVDVASVDSLICFHNYGKLGTYNNVYNCLFIVIMIVAMATFLVLLKVKHYSSMHKNASRLFNI